MDILQLHIFALLLNYKIIESNDLETANSTDPDQKAPVMSKSKSTHTDKDVSKRFQCTIKQKTF